MFNKIKQSRMSNYVNCWRVKLGNSFYAILPAHCAIYKPKNKGWVRSNFLNMCRTDLNLQWHVSINWDSSNGSIENDLAWAKLDKSDYYFSVGTNMLNNEQNNEQNNEPIDVQFFFNQPYDYKGKLLKTASFGKVNGVAYASPNSEMLEALNIGFKGMSGAIAVNNNNDLIGMFVRRGVSLGVGDQTTVDPTIQVTEQLAPQSMTLSRGMIIPSNVIAKLINSPSVSIKDLC